MRLSFWRSQIFRTQRANATIKGHTLYQTEIILDMEDNTNGHLERTSSQTSNASTKSHTSGTVRVKARRYASNTSAKATSTPNRSLTSFPSLSPDESPRTVRAKDLTRAKPTEPVSEAPQKPSKYSPSIVERLTTSTASFRGRSALFDDSTAKAQDIPGALHHASDKHIERLIARIGAVALVRQLAADLAQRDAQVTTLRQHAEERERELKRMLREVEVSNLDIETRLHNLEKSTRRTSVEHGKATGGHDKRRASVTRSSASEAININDMMNDAMGQLLGDSLELDEGYLDTLDQQDRQATIRPNDALSAHNYDGSSITSGGAAKGWKDYMPGENLASCTTSSSSSVISGMNQKTDTTLKSRTSSAGLARRMGLSSDVFQPPDNDFTLSRSKTALSETKHELHGGNDSDSQSRKSSISVTSWALKLFAGNPAAGREGDKQRTVRGRAATMGGGVVKSSRNASLASVETGSSAKAALMKVSSKSSNAQLPRKTVPSLSATANGPTKGAAHEGWRHIKSSIISPGSPITDVSADSATNLGPVEMDTILPPDSRPPTLTQTYNDYHPTEFLTDRFGFIYDQRRKKRSLVASENVAHRRSGSGVEMLTAARDATDVVVDTNSIGKPTSTIVGSPKSTDMRPETPASMEEAMDEKTVLKWQDFLKVANYPTELLSHTPSAAAITTLANADADATPKHRASLPLPNLNAQPKSPPVVAVTADLNPPSDSTLLAPESGARTEPEPVKLLLEQLTELHDTLQREKTIKWNEFLRKVRADRKREGDAAILDGRMKQALMPEVSLTDGEMIGVAGLGNKGKVGRAKWIEFKSLVLGGIPVAYRAKIWAECSGASALRAPGYYEDLVNNGVDDPVIVAQIQMDINRTLTDNVFFRCGPGVTKLNEVLLAYSRRNPDVGYCQGMNLIAASLLLIMPTAEDAFWVLASMVENILPDHYYDSSLLASRADQQVLRQYVADILPTLSTHLEDLGIELEALTFQWFLSVFTDCLSAEALFRVWDVVLCTNDGSTFLFQVALALLKLNEKSLMKCDTPAAVYGYINHEMTNHAISIDGLINASDALKKVVKRAEVEERRAKAVEKEREVMRERESSRAEAGGRRGGTGEQAKKGQAEVSRAGQVGAMDDRKSSETGCESQSLRREAGDETETSAGDAEGEVEDEGETPGELDVYSPTPVDDAEGILGASR